MKQLCYMAIAMVMVISCSKDENENCDTPQGGSSAEFPLSENSYWVYKHLQISGSDTTDLGLDTLRIIGEEIIDGETYSLFSYLVPFPSNLRMEDNQLYTSSGLWAELALGDSIFLAADTIFLGEEPFVGSIGYMSPVQQTITVDAGSFNCYHRMTQYTSFDEDYPHGVRTDNYYIANEVGVVQFNYFYYSNPDNFLYQLVDYNIE